MKRIAFATLTVAALVCCALSRAPISEASTSPGRCADPVLPHPTRASAALDGLSAPQARTAARTSRMPLAQLRTVAADDDTLWLDRCGAAYYVEEADPHPPTAARATTGAAVTSLANTFSLNSRPGAAKTIYLDFTGRTVTGTAWNDSYGSSIVAKPFSITAPVDTNFSDAELTEIQTAWAIVAEDYAPFDVNVTTQDPGSAALLRSDSSDTQWGVRVLVTNDGPIFSSCGCGGLAYVDVFDAVSPAGSYSPAWVFANGTGTNGKGIGEAAAHEAGHTLGLHHDGAGSSAYSVGGTPWAPIMGAAYYQPVSQWSAGEYTSSTNTEDDVAIIASHLGVVADDHGDTADTATELTSGVATAGLIMTRADVDAFSLQASGTTMVDVTAPRGYSDLDVQMTVLDDEGNLLAVADPEVAATSASVATGLGASWAAALPDDGTTTLTFLVEGVGAGNGRSYATYSDYASLGNYTITATTGGDGDGDLLTVTPSPLPAATVGTPYAASAATAEGGTAPYTFTASDLPDGLELTASGTLTGTPTEEGTYPLTISATDALGTTGGATTSLTVGAAAPQALAANPVTIYGEVGRAIDLGLTATGGTGSYGWQNKTLPSWLSVSTGGRLTGTPTSTRGVTGYVTVTSGSESATVLVKLSFAAAPVAASGQTLALTGPSVSTRTKVPISQQLAPTGGTGTYVYKYRGLPSGVRLNTRTGAITGAATKAGTYVATVTVTSGTEVVSTPVTFVVDWQPLTADNASVAGVTGKRFSVRLKALNGAGAYAWSSTGLPAAMSLTKSGTLTGTFTELVDDVFPVTVTSGAYKKTVLVTVKITASPIKWSRYLTSSTLTRPRAYTLTWRVIGGLAPYTWNLGTLPAGLSATTSGDTVTITGTPTTAAVSTVNVAVADRIDQALTKSWKITVK
ncbi:putative Ig domain-containing protein [Nocardioides mangrovi]|uniref:Ig domain-containing protein n=1 Tax=Nocardioides mangrovi TaxID=2874580 RepID=A0ABS7UDQ9_9ACTN|nr:putative Ig domain-containing protein [Nocardioides mangrovi]MBZ5739133.1 putative Ig domain-containing protein [Nocardioides mangrovi]